jgi:2-haloacid dehalogenase
MKHVKALTFDLFGTVLDLTGSLHPSIQKFLEGKSSGLTSEQMWAQWRDRQRLEQFRDTMMMLGHCGYLEAVRRALIYTLRHNCISYSADEVEELMAAWQQLNPFPEVEAALARLRDRFTLVVLSNGEPDYLDFLVKERCPFGFNKVISVNEAGAFKPHPGVYRRAAQILGSEPGELMMVSAHPFDVAGARACGYQGAFVNRYGFPDDDRFPPNLEVDSFTALADALL